MILYLWAFFCRTKNQVYKSYIYKIKVKKKIQLESNFATCVPSNLSFLIFVSNELI